MFRKFFSSSSSVARPKDLPAHVQLRYQLFRNRWHLDSREPVSFIVLHDVFESSGAVSPFVSSITKLPTTGVSPTLPLDIFVPDLRGHGLSAVAAPESAVDMLSHTSDVLGFYDSVVEFKNTVHLIGFGHGARVALATALADPQRFASVTAVDAMLDASRTKNVWNALRSLPPAETQTLKTMNAALQRVVPSESERLALLLNFEEKRSETSPARWRSAFFADGLKTEDDVQKLHQWPAAALSEASFGGVTRLVKYKQAAAAGELPAGLEAKQFTSCDAVSISASATPMEVVQAVLTNLELSAPVESVLAEAHGGV